MIRLVIVENHPAIADGLASLLRGVPDIEVVGLASTPRDAHVLLDRETPDVVLCDVMLGPSDAGFGLLAAHGDRSAFLMYSAFDYPAHHVRAIEGGALGYLSKSVEVEVIIRAIRRAAEGSTSFPPSVLASARQAPRRPTAREQQLLLHLSRGATNEDLAASLGLVVKSVEGMIRRLFDRYGVDNRTQLARFALAQGWLTGGNGDGSEQPAAGTDAVGGGAGEGEPVQDSPRRGSRG